MQCTDGSCIESVCRRSFLSAAEANGVNAEVVSVDVVYSQPNLLLFFDRSLHMDTSVLVALVLFIVISLAFSVATVGLFKRLVNPKISSLKWTMTMYTNLTSVSNTGCRGADGWLVSTVPHF
jgi:hypothetical protein